jgi:hypothetical protein
MTALLDLTRSDRRAEVVADRRLQLWARAAMSALSTAAVSMAVVVVLALVAWAADPRSGGTAGSASRVGLGLWLLAARVPLHLTAGSVALPPLGLTLVMIVLLARSAATLLSWQRGDDDLIDLRGDTTPPLPPSPPTRRQAGEVVGALMVPFAVITTLAAVLARDGSMRPSLVVAPFAGMALAAIAGLVGTREAGWLGTGSLLDRLGPEWARAVPLGLAGAARAAIVLVGGAMVLVLGSLAWHGHQALQLAGRVGGGPVGAAGIALVCLALLPNAVFAGVGYLTGTGISVGAGTSVSLSGVHLGVVPPLPLLAALPHGPAGFAVRCGCWLVVVAAGALAGLRRSVAAPQLRDLPWRDVLAELAVPASIAVGACALLIGVAVSLAGGPAGPGRLSTLGASGVMTGALLVGELAVAAAAAILVRLSWARYGPDVGSDV